MHSISYHKLSSLLLDILYSAWWTRFLGILKPLNTFDQTSALLTPQSWQFTFLRKDRPLLLCKADVHNMGRCVEGTHQRVGGWWLQGAAPGGLHGQLRPHPQACERAVGIHLPLRWGPRGGHSCTGGRGDQGAQDAHPLPSPVCVCRAGYRSEPTPLPPSSKITHHFASKRMCCFMHGKLLPLKLGKLAMSSKA